jgi:hypothetical protein
MHKRCDEVEIVLLSSIHALEFGELIPEELVFTGRVQCLNILPAEEALLDAIVEYGTPVIINVADRRPIWAVFEFHTKAGKAKKKIKFS